MFYNKSPFPDYDLDRFGRKEDLWASASSFSRALDASIPPDASVIDVGTGTGQLSALLSIRRKNVWGIDFSDSSLNKARALKEKLCLDSLTLKRIDLMDAHQIEAIGQKFDYVLCMGVLHHTSDASRGFDNILRLLGPRGCIAVGLYNTFGRIPLRGRILLAKTVFKNNDRVKDWFIRMQIGDTKDKERARGWWNDQYLHPHETCHTVGEVLRWFRDHGITYQQTVPSLRFSGKSDVNITGLWNPFGEKYPGVLRRALQQIFWVWSTHHEGGYWITFGRKDP